MSVYLGIDTSNYTTSISTVCGDSIEHNLKLPVTVKDGDHGIRQSDAVFLHVKNLPQLFKTLGRCDADAVGVSAYPRDASGSYMPCFLSGVSAAYAFASAKGIPVYLFSHQAGHIAAAAYSANRLDLLSGRFIAFHVSGGTTECLLVEGIDNIKKIGGTLDLNAGQIIDRIGTRVGFDFPSGKYIEKSAIEWYNQGNKPPKVRTSVKGTEFNLSGVENIAEKMIKDGKSVPEVSAYILEFIKKSLEAVLDNAKSAYGDLPVLFAGGVMSCSIIREYFMERYNAYFAHADYSSDNAAGIAVLCKMKHEGKI